MDYWDWVCCSYLELVIFNYYLVQVLLWWKFYLSRVKLKVFSRIFVFFFGFVMVVMVEVQLEIQYQYFWLLLIVFSVCIMVLVVVYLFVFFISICILFNVEVVSNIYNLNFISEFLYECMYFYIELVWGFFIVLGILFFLVEVVLFCWIKFFFVDVWCQFGFLFGFGSYMGWQVVLVFIIIMVFVGFIFVVFIIYFYCFLVCYKMECYNCEIEEFYKFKVQLDGYECSLQVV